MLARICLKQAAAAFSAGPFSQAPSFLALGEVVSSAAPKPMAQK